MKIYTNKNYEVLSLDVQPDQYVYEIETDKTREEILVLGVSNVLENTGMSQHMSSC